MERGQVSELTKGLVIIVLGLLFLGDQLGWAREWQFGRLWPLLLIVFGLGRLLGSGGRGRRSGGLTMALFGGILLMHTQRVMDLQQSWPLFIVVGGISVIVGAFFCRDGRDDAGAAR
ncbi:MAG: DUF5668 domain-containing protein [Vicinamibacterales bacterium]